MANKIYPKWKEAVEQHTGGSALNGSGATGVYAILVDANTYTYSDAHQYYTDLSGLGGTEQEIGATKSYTNGVFDGADISFPSVAGVVQYEALALFIKNGGASSTWRLFAYLDTGITGLPVTSNGTNVNVTWHATGIVAL